MAKTHYEVLGVSRSASKSDIEAACLRLGEEWRTDKNDSADAKARFSEIEKAYEILADEQRRLEYDEAIATVEGLERKTKRNGAFFGWGITLLIIGALSFIIPLLGRQFVVILPFVAMGLHPAAVGLLFVIVGGALIEMAKSE